MSEGKTIRINKVLKDLNISLATAVEELKKHKNIEIEESLNTKITEEAFEFLSNKFKADKNKRAVSKEIGIQLFQYILFGLYVSHVKSRLIEIREGKRHYGPVVAICTVLFSLSWLIGTIIYFVWYLGSFSILGTILFSLSLLIPILYQIYYRKEFSVNRQFTYLHWYLIVMSFLYGFFFII